MIISKNKQTKKSHFLVKKKRGKNKTEEVCQTAASCSISTMMCTGFYIDQMEIRGVFTVLR